jgi:hypothetical protein
LAVVSVAMTGNSGDEPARRLSAAKGQFDFSRIQVGLTNVRKLA